MSDTFIWLIPLLVVVFLLKFALARLEARERGGSFEYCDIGGLFSDGELAFLDALRSVVPRTHTVIGKVRIADIVRPDSKYKGRQYIRAFNRISAKHVDFVVCDRVSYKVKAILELDDISHRKPKRISRDAFVDSVFTQAGIPIFHFPAQASYDPSAIRETIDSAFTCLLEVDQGHTANL
jgi:very-short-patch-repair endonuclease